MVYNIMQEDFAGAWRRLNNSDFHAGDKIKRRVTVLKLKTI